MVDIASLTLKENRGYSYAILLAKVLPKEYIDKINREMETDYTVFSETDELADKLALVIQENGCNVRIRLDRKKQSVDHRKIWGGIFHVFCTYRYAFEYCKSRNYF